MICDLSNDRTSTYNYKGDWSWARGVAAALKAPPPGSCLFWRHQRPGAMSLNLLFAGKG